jgi:hypothetical protein
MAKLGGALLFLVLAAGAAACTPAGDTGGGGQTKTDAAAGAGGRGAGPSTQAGTGGSGGSQPPSSSTGGTGGGNSGAGGNGPVADGGNSSGAGGGAGSGGMSDGGGSAPALSGDGLQQKLLAGSIGLGYYTACHIAPDSSLRCFGDRHPRTMPPAGLKPTQIACSHDGCCIVQPREADTRIRCWSDKRTIFPPDAVAKAVDPIQIGIGYQHGCVLNADNGITCWGQPGTMNAAPAGLKAKSLHVAAYFQCAVKMDDTVTCWGINPPLPPADLKAKLVSAIVHTGGHLDEAPGLTRHACAIQLDDTLRCWGDNVDGTTDVPADLGPVRDVGVNTYSTCALKPDGAMVCWGTRKYFPERYKAPPAGLTLKAIKGQFGGYCGLRLDDTLACWGEEKTTHLTVPAGLKLLVP